MNQPRRRLGDKKGAIVPIRLLIVSYTLSGGGAERFASNLIGCIDRSRFDVHLCLVKNEVTYPLPPDVPVISLDKTRPWHVFSAVLKLRRLVKSIKPDVVLTNIAYTSQLMGLAKVTLDQPFVWVARTGSAPAAREHGLFRRFNGYLYKNHVDTLVCNSAGLAAGASEHYGLPPSGIHVILNLADFDRLDKLAAEPAGIVDDGEGPVMLSVARLSPEKRHDVLLEAFARIREQVNARLWICGSGPLEARIRQQVRELGLESSVDMLGFQENPYPLMSRADIFVSTSDLEGLPNALVEAQGLGLPAVATNCDFGPREIISQGITGFLVPTGSVKQVAEALLRLLQSESMRTQFGEAAKERSREIFGRATIIRQWESLLGTRLS